MIISNYTRSWLKAVTWRVVATATTMTLVYAFTGKLEAVVGVGFFDVIMKMIFYFQHERAWNTFGFGRSLRVDEGLLTILASLSDIESV